MIMKYRFLLALTVSTAFFVGSPAYAETLQDSVDKALIAHPSVEAALAEKVVAKEDRLEIRSDLFPIVSANLTAGRIFGDNSTSRGLTVDRGTAYSWLGEGSTSLTQPFFDGGETFNRMDAAQARSSSADYNVLDVKENLAYRAAQVHLAVMQTQATLEKTKSYYAVIEDYLGRIQMMVDEGVADETEVAQARNISLMLESTIVDYEGQLETAYAGYQEIVGSLPDSDLLKPVVSTSLVDMDVDSAVHFAKISHPSVRVGVKNLEASGYDVRAEKSKFYPDIDGELSYLKRDQKEEIGGEATDARALIKMRWDFETGGAQMARTRKSRAQYSETLAQNRDTARTVEGDVRRAYVEYETAQKQMNLVKNREKVTKGLFEAYESQFEGARVRLLQLMQAENQLFNAQLASVAAEYRYLLAQYGILASIGKLIESVDVASVAVTSKKTIEKTISVPVAEKQKKADVVVLSPDAIINTLYDTAK